MTSTSKIVYVRWGPNRNRANEFARLAGAQLLVLRWHSRRLPLAVLRYFVQFAQTVTLLFVHRPSWVISQHTQPFCSLAALTYCQLAGKVLINDCHNAPFVNRIWLTRPLDALNRAIFRRAKINLVHNAPLLDYIKMSLRLSGNFAVLEDPIPDYLPVDHAAVWDEEFIMAICSFGQDEPIEELLEACERTPEFKYYITGNKNRIRRRLKDRMPENVVLTGYIDDAAYDRLLSGARVALSLSTRGHVLMRANYDALAAHVPIVTSDNPASRLYLKHCAVFTENEPMAIAGAVRQAVAERDTLANEIRTIVEEKHREWHERWADICAKCNGIALNKN